MANEKSNAVRFNIKQNILQLTASHTTLGEASEQLDIQFDDDERELEIAFNARFIIEMLSIFENEEINFGLNNEISPVQVTSPLHENLLCIIMPVKI